MTVTPYCAHRVESFAVHIAFGPLNQGTAQERDSAVCMSKALQFIDHRWVGGVEFFFEW